MNYKFNKIISILFFLMFLNKTYSQSIDSVTLKSDKYPCDLYPKLINMLQLKTEIDTVPILYFTSSIWKYGFSVSKYKFRQIDDMKDILSKETYLYDDKFNKLFGKIYYIPSLKIEIYDTNN